VGGTDASESSAFEFYHDLEGTATRCALLLQVGADGCQIIVGRGFAQ
jgi:hypothetical protein